MITRNNLKDIFNLLNNEEKYHIKSNLCNFEYVRLDVSFFNVGATVNYNLVNDIPDDYDELIASGNCAFLELSEIYNLIEYSMDKETIDRNLRYYEDYFTCLFWADIEANDDFNEDERSLCVSDIDEQSLIESFIELDLFFFRADKVLNESNYKDNHKQTCHDFYLTRCGHGCGFWEADFCTKEQGEKLTELAQEFGTVDISINGETIYF